MRDCGGGGAAGGAAVAGRAAAASVGGGDGLRGGVGRLLGLHGQLAGARVDEVLHQYRELVESDLELKTKIETDLCK